MAALRRAHAPPPLDLRFLSVPYVPTWDVLRRMCESERRATPVVSTVLDMGAFYDGDELDADDCKHPICVVGAPSGRGIALAAAVCLALLLIAAFRVRVPAPPIRFVREKI